MDESLEEIISKFQKKCLRGWKTEHYQDKIFVETENALFRTKLSNKQENSFVR